VGWPSVCTVTHKCGDGILNLPYEQCDDGNRMPYDGCNPDCSLMFMWSCPVPNVSPCPNTCGNGIRAGAEVCDDWNTISGDGCSNNCALVEPGFWCSSTLPAGGKPDVCWEIRLDGIDYYFYGCDDGNSKDGDGCNWMGQIESGFWCNNGRPPWNGNPG